MFPLNFLAMFSIVPLHAQLQCSPLLQRKYAVPAPVLNMVSDTVEHPQRGNPYGMLEHVNQLQGAAATEPLFALTTVLELCRGNKP